MTGNPSPRDLAGDPRLPIYQRLAETIGAWIRDGALVPGQQLLSEVGLAEQFGVAPGTVRQALTDLAKLGLVERVQGRGTFVRAPRQQGDRLAALRLLAARSEPADAALLLWAASEIEDFRSGRAAQDAERGAA